jgi:acyl-CoA dehydrogenase
MYSAPSDELGQQIVDLITYPTDARTRLCAGIYSTAEPGNPLGLLQQALEAAEAAAPLESKLRDAARAEVISGNDSLALIASATAAGVLTAAEAEQLRALDEQVMALIAVDDFDGKELGTKTPGANRKRSKKVSKKSSPATS